VTIGDLIRVGKLLEVHCSSCRPCAPSLYRGRQSRSAQAHAGTGGDQPSRLQRLWRQEQRDLQPDLGKARCEGRGFGQHRYLTEKG
jgi:hypothetical protein